MKPLPILVFSLLVSFQAQGQHWNLILDNRISNYKLDTESLMSAHIWADSVQATAGGDTLFFLNRIAKLFFDEESGWVKYGLTNQQQFLQRQVRRSQDGGYRLEGDSATFVLFAGLPLGAEWLFDTLRQITALVQSAYEQSTFGVLDSLQTILLSTQDTLILSKTFGILRFPDFSAPGHFFELLGLDGTDFGLQSPMREDFYLIEPGDELYYNSGEGGPDPGGFLEKGRFILEEKYTENDTLNLRFNITYRSEILDLELGDFVYIGTDNEQEIWRIPPGHFSNAYKGQIVPIPGGSGYDALEFSFICVFYPYDSILYGVVDYYLAEDGSLMKGIGRPKQNWWEVLPLLALAPEGDSLLVYDGMPDWDYRVAYQQGPGLKYWEGQCFEIGAGRELVGYIIDGDSTGQVYSHEFLFHTDTKENASETDPIRVSPNPFHHTLYLEAPSGFRISEVRVFSSTGALTALIAADGSSDATLDLSGLLPGVYELLVYDPEGKGLSARVVKR